MIWGQTYDVVLVGGHVIDPRNGINSRMDVAIQNGRIAAVAPSISTTGKAQRIDVRGLYLTPGFQCELTLRDGAVVFDWDGRTSTDYTTLLADYGLRDGVDVMVPPPSPWPAAK